MTPEEFWNILHDVPEQKPIFYRLYYNNDGSPNVYTMEDLPGKYIDIDKTVYVRGPTNIKVVDGEIVEIIPKQIIRKLQPSAHGTICSLHNVCIVVNEYTNT